MHLIMKLQGLIMISECINSMRIESSMESVNKLLNLKLLFHTYELVRQTKSNILEKA